MYHRIYHDAHSMNTVSLRLVNTYGPRQLVRHAKQGFTGWFVKKAIDGEEIQIYGDGQQLRGFNFVDDVSVALMTAGIRENTFGQAFNLGGQEPFTLECFVKLLLKITGRGTYRKIPFPEDKKAIDIVGLDLRDIASFTEFFVIATGNNQRQVQAIADEINEQLKKQLQTRPVRIEGYSSAEWVLLDYGDFVFHIFNGEAREFYDLARLWRDARKVDIPSDL